MRNDLAESLGVQPGITAIIGSGGKTSLMRALSRELSAGGSRVLLTTTTHILPFKDVPCLRVSSNEDASWVMDKLAEYTVQVSPGAHDAPFSHVWEICFGSGLLPGVEAGFCETIEGSASFNPKLSEPGFPLYELLPAADYILTEADGARHHYMKAHAHYEPVIPERCGRTILVIGAQGFGMPVEEAVHRPEIFCRLTGTQPGDIMTPALYAELLRQEAAKGLSFDCILLNGVNSERRLAFASEFADRSGGSVVFADLPLA